MNRCASKDGFTLLEMLVASLLLGMLVTILTMVFNSSSIAWRTGKAGISQMTKARYQLSLAQQTADNAMPRIHPTQKSMMGRVQGAWMPDGTVRRRAVSVLQSSDARNLYKFPEWDSKGSAGSQVARPWAIVDGIDQLKTGQSTSFTVGVLSWGPDGKPDTADDINTWPDELDE